MVLFTITREHFCTRFFCMIINNNKSNIQKLMNITNIIISCINMKFKKKSTSSDYRVGYWCRNLKRFTCTLSIDVSWSVTEQRVLYCYMPFIRTDIETNQQQQEKEFYFHNILFTYLKWTGILAFIKLKQKNENNLFAFVLSLNWIETEKMSNLFFTIFSDHEIFLCWNVHWFFFLTYCCYVDKSYIL